MAVKFSDCYYVIVFSDGFENKLRRTYKKVKDRVVAKREIIADMQRLGFPVKRKFKTRKEAANLLKEIRKIKPRTFKATEQMDIYL